MLVREFVAQVREDADLEYLGVVDERFIRVRDRNRGSGQDFTLDDIRHNNWRRLRGVALRQEDPQVLTWLTRIVGYFSVTRSWNASKIEELKDRQKGQYAVDDTAARGRGRA
jgi:hypothetical protein